MNAGGREQRPTRGTSRRPHEKIRRMTTHGTTPITNEYMGEMLAQTSTYSLVLLQAGPNYDAPESAPVKFEHGRRNFALRAEGVLAIVCPVTDNTELCGLGIFNATEAETVAIMDGDPGVQAEVFTYEVHPVRSFPGDALP